MTRSIVLLAALVASGCAFYSADSTPMGNARFAPSDRVEVVAAPPAGAALVGRVSERGNNYASAEGCREHAVREARALGATAVVFTHEEAGAVIGKGPLCEADAYR